MGDMTELAPPRAEPHTDRHAATLTGRLFLRRPIPAVPGSLPGPGRYLVVDGGTGTRLVALGAEVLHIGRGLSADLRIDDHWVSRRHALLIHHVGGVRLVDDRSANGTTVNGESVSEVELRDGDVIALGRTNLLFIDRRR
jgi:pSer/pThr/pTyr-binding forkhead associated (FHA) protein